MKWLKRVFLTFLMLLLLAGGGLGALKVLLQRKPSWYPSAVLDPAAIAAAARSANDKIMRVQDWAASSKAKQDRAAQGTTGPFGDSAGEPAQSETIAFTEAELNAFFSQWDDSLHWSDRYEDYVRDPMLILQDDRLIFAATVKEANVVVSLHLEPKLDEQGMLRLKLVEVLGGKIPLPRFLWDRYRQTLSSAMTRKLDQVRTSAKIRADGSANSAAVGAAMNRLLLHALNEEPADPVLFLPHDVTHPENGFPVKLTAVRIANKTITLTVVPMDAAERQSLLGRIREPYTVSTGSSPPVAQAAGPSSPKR